MNHKEEYKKWNKAAEAYIEKNLKLKLIDKIKAFSGKDQTLENFVFEREQMNKRKDILQWNKDVVAYCEKNKIDIGPKPVRNQTKKDKVVAKTHHLEHFSVQEHMGKHGAYLKISYKKHAHHKQDTDKPHTGQPQHQPKKHSGQSQHESTTPVYSPSMVTHTIPKQSTVVPHFQTPGPQFQTPGPEFQAPGPKFVSHDRKFS